MKANIKIVGIAPLLMCSIDINRLHWLVVLYQRDGRVVLPADNLLACVHTGSTLSKMGTAVKQAAPYTDHEAYVLDHDGPKNDLDALYADGRFVDARMGCPQGPVHSVAQPSRAKRSIAQTLRRFDRRRGGHFPA